MSRFIGTDQNRTPVQSDQRLVLAGRKGLLHELNPDVGTNAEKM